MLIALVVELVDPTAIDGQGSSTVEVETTNPLSEVSAWDVSCGKKNLTT